MEYEKEIYEFLNGDVETKGFNIQYLSGPKIISMGKHFALEKSYRWGEFNSSRWKQMQELINHVEKVQNLDAFFHFYFFRSIYTQNDSQGQKQFFHEINKRLSVYGQKLGIVDKKIKVIATKKEVILEDVNLDLNDSDVQSGKVWSFGGQAQILTSHDKGKLIKKLMIPQTHKNPEKLKERFFNEFRILQLTDNKYTLPVYELDETDVSYTMDKASGNFYELEESMNDIEKIIFAIQTLKCIQYIHNENIYHRDLSPDNILKLKDRWILTDFGISKDLDSPELTTTGTALGKQDFMHPDILEDLSLWKTGYHFKYDWYAFGQILKYMNSSIQNKDLKQKLLKLANSIISNDVDQIKYTDTIDELKKMVLIIEF